MTKMKYLDGYFNIPALSKGCPESISTVQEQMGILSARARPNRRSNTKWCHFVRQSALNDISNLVIDGLKTLSKED